MVSRPRGSYLCLWASVVAVLVLAGLPVCADAMEQAPDIFPGRGVRNDFFLGQNVHFALEAFEERYRSPIDRRAFMNYPEGGGSIDTGYGVVLHFDPGQYIWQIVVLNSQMFTDRWIRVYSHRDEIFRAYGTSYNSQPVEGGYYLSYDWAGVGFDIDGVTQLVRAIVVFYPAP